MSLNYDLTSIKDRADHFPPEADGTLNATLMSLIWYSIPCGFSGITSKNHGEVYLRLTMFHRLIGPMFWRSTDDDPEPITVRRVDVERAVGLRTNASPMSRPTFLKDLAGRVERTLP